jgi:hypothetical protein
VGPTARGERAGSRSGGPHPTVTGPPTSRRGGNPTCGPDRGVGNQRPFSRPVVTTTEKNPGEVTEGRRMPRLRGGAVTRSRTRWRSIGRRGSIGCVSQSRSLPLGGTARPPRLVSTSRACSLSRPDQAARRITALEDGIRVGRSSPVPRPRPRPTHEPLLGFGFFHLCFYFPIPNTDRSAYHEDPDG